MQIQITETSVIPVNILYRLQKKKKKASTVLAFNSHSNKQENPDISMALILEQETNV